MSASDRAAPAAGPAAALRVLADLAPQGAATRDAVGPGPLVWLVGACTTWVGDGPAPDGPGAPAGELTLGVPHQARGLNAALQAGLADLAARDELHREQQLLRQGQLWLAGPVDGTGRRPWLLPLLAMPVRIPRTLGVPRPPVQAGDLEVADVLQDVPDAEQRLLHAALQLSELGVPLTQDAVDRAPRVAELVGGVLADAGLPPADLVVSGQPRALRDGDRVVVEVGHAGCYVAAEGRSLHLGPTLRRWATRPLDGTAFAALYGEPGAPPPAADAAVRSPLPLTPAQEAAVLDARTQPVSVLSGAPGTGKSHAAVAIALDEVARGGAVLLATRSGHAAEVLAGLLDRHPGPTPVLFGGSERRRDLAARLAAGLPDAAADGERAALEAAVAAADARVAAVRRVLAEALSDEAVAAAAPELLGRVAVLARTAPGAFDGRQDLTHLAGLLARATAPADGPLGRWRARRADRRLRRALGAPAEASAGELGTALELARVQRTAARLATGGAVDLGPLWAELDAAEEALRRAVGSRLDGATRGPRDARGRRAVAALATALRAGRATRRRALAMLSHDSLVASLPLWIGTLDDIEDLLPAVPGLFDLVVLDEASQIDQVRAAPALLRARRAVVVGDPRQLRHVSFTADADVRAAITAHGADALADRLEVRRDSVFDLAAGVAPVRWLDEHLRSVPHLIEFSSRRFYDGRLTVATRHPAVDRLDAIDTVTVAGSADDDGVVAAEVEAVLRLVTDLADEGTTSIGVVTPLRAQATALEAALLARFDADRIAALELRVGTVHAFQGGERDVVVLSTAVTPDAPAGRRRFVEDPNLFNVMVTRARRRMIVVTSLDPTVGGLLGDYLAHAERPPTTPRTAVAAGWAADLAEELRRAGLPVRTGYPVGPHVVDIVVGDGPTAEALITLPHPAGPAAHAARRATLRRAGWRVREVFPARYEHRPALAVAELAPVLQAAGG